MPDLTRLLDAASGGDHQAAAAILPLVYDELRRLAAVRMAGEAPGPTLDATALVHEAYLCLRGIYPDQPWDGPGHFFAAEAMRHILVERARKRATTNRRGGRPRLDPAAVGASPDLLLQRPTGLSDWEE